VESKQWQKEEQKSQRTEHPQIAGETQKIGRSFCERSSSTFGVDRQLVGQLGFRKLYSFLEDLVLRSSSKPSWSANQSRHSQLLAFRRAFNQEWQKVGNRQKLGQSNLKMG